jgi:hypothetical protein
MVFNSATFSSLLQQHGSSKVSTFSGSFTEPNQSAIKAFAVQVPAEARKARLAQTHGFCFVDANGRLRKVSCLLWHFKPDGSKLLVGSRGELVSHCVPISISGDPFSPNHFVSLASQEMATLMALPHFTIGQRDPCQADPPDGVDTNREIHWPLPSEAECPVFSVFPTIFPLLEGIFLPDTINLTNPLPTTWSDETPPKFVAWLRALKYIFDHNNGKSLHAFSKMFNADEIPMAAAYVGLSFADAPTVSIAQLDFETDEYEAVLKSFKQARELAYLRVSDSAIIPAPPNGGGNNGGDNSNGLGSALAKSMGEIVENSKLTGAERERKISQKDVIEQWRIMTATVTDANVIEPGTLSKVFKEILLRQNKSLAVETYRKEYSDFLSTKRAQHPNNFVYRQATHIEEVVTHVFVTALQTFRWMGRGWIDAGAHIKTELCVAHFFPNPVKSAVFTDYVHAGQRVLQQEAIGEDKSKSDAKQSDLFYHGRISSLSDLISTICNLIVTFDFMLADMDSKPPFFLKPIRGLLDAIQGDSGRDWLNKHSAVDHLYVALAAEVQQMLLPFINLATNTSIRRSLKANQPLSLTHFVEARNICKSPMERVYGAITTGSLGHFREETVLAFLVTPTSSPSKKHDSSGGTSSVIPPTKKAKNDKETPNRSSDSPKDLTGFLKLTHYGRITWPAFLVVHPKTKENGRLCAFHMFKGKSCNHGKDCRRVHISKMSDLPPAERSKLTQYVNDTEGVEFVEPPTSNQGS